MTDAGYVFAGYAVTGGVLVVYAAYLLRRARILARSVPPEERPWR